MHLCHGVRRRSGGVRDRFARRPGVHCLGFTPEEMGKGNWSVGVIADERASAEQRDAIRRLQTTRDTRPQIASCWRVRRGATCRRLVWPGMTQPAETMDSTRDFPDAAPSASNQPRATILESALGLGFLISRWRGGSVSTARASAV